ncbi:MAG: hypothetical protein P1U34_07695 [Coxiellaceae bacterium]|nr:hypothetical protein [Coxiellaceae bacterium]
MWRTLTLGLFFALFSINAFAAKVTSLPEYGLVSSPQYAGYVSITKKACAKTDCPNSLSLYYWLITSDQDYKSKPLIIWFNGGPGASNMFGPFMESGPYKFNKSGTLVRNKYSWSRFANYMIIEQPLSVGASTITPKNKKFVPHNNSQSSKQFYNALQHIIEQHPFLKRHKIYLMGESYAGKTIAFIATEMLSHKKQKGMHLGGIMVNDIWVNPLLQQSYDSKYAYTHGMIDANQKLVVDKVYDRCKSLILQHTPSSIKANIACSKIMSTIKEMSGLHLSNIMQPAPDYTALSTYLSKGSVQQAMHMKPHSPYMLFSNLISKNFTPGEQDSNADLYSKLLTQGVEIVIMSGLLDATDSNFLGIDAMIQQLQWPGKQKYMQTKSVQWKDNDKAKTVLGYIKSDQKLARVKVLDGGHMLPYDQPKVARLVKEFVSI